jgi:amino acid transporter
MNPNKVFIREATGVVREVSALHASIISLAVINLAGAFALGILTVVIVLPGANVGLAFLLTIPFVIINALAYAMMTEAMPRSGGDYIWMSRILHPAFGFAFEWVVAIFQALFFGTFVAYTVNSSLSSGFGSLGLIVGNSSMVGLSQFLASNTGVIVVGSLMVLLVFLLDLIALTNYLKIQLVLYAFVLVSVLLFFGVFLSTDNAGFQASFNSFFSAYNVTYTGVISQAQNSGFTNPGIVSLGSATLLAIPYSFFAIIGWSWPALVGGELKNVRKAMRYGCVVTGVMAAIIVAAGSFLVQDRLGASFFNAAAYLSSSGSYSAPVPFNTYYLAMVINRNPVLDTLLVIGLTAQGLVLVSAGTLVYSRVFMAWGFDRVMPTKMADVSDRFHTPVVAVGVFALLLEVGVILTLYAGVVFSQINITLILILLYAFVGLAAMLFPYRKKNVYELSPFKNSKVAGVPTIAIVGAVNFVVFLILSVFCLYYPSLSGPTGASALAFMAAVFGIGLVIFYASWFYNKRRGIPIDLAFKEIPPE